MKQCEIIALIWPVLLLGVPEVGAQKGTFTDPTAAGADFRVQGEYEGELAGKGKVGAQVVALGNGMFHIYFHTGGLPGAGWDGRPRSKATAVTRNGKTTLSGGGWTGILADGKLTANSPDRIDVTLKQVVRRSPTLGAKAPANALVLFDGTNLNHWQNGELVESNLLRCGTRSKQTFGTGKLHLEFRLPFKPTARGQGRCNSGVHIHGVEIQILDTFGLIGEKTDCGAFYNVARPAVNMCLPPLSWQTYDIEARPGPKETVLLTVWHNGVQIHENFVVKSKGGAVPLALQDHGDPVVFRNIWVAPLEVAGSGDPSR